MAVVFAASSSKFFAARLNGAESVVFITYLFVVMPSAAGVCDTADMLHDTVLFALNRIKDVTIGVLVAAIVSFFVTPEHAADTLARTQLEALGCAAGVVGATAEALRLAAAPRLGATMDHLRTTDFAHPGAAAQHIRSTSSAQDLQELRKRTWSCQEALFFGGDGRPGQKDALTEVSWERRLRSDVGRPLFGGLLWVPGWCCCERMPARAPGLLAALPVLSRVLRISHCLLSVVEPGFENGADVLLGGAPVRDALGTEGEGLAAELHEAVEALQAHVAESASGARGRAARGRRGKEAVARVAEARDRMHRLCRGAAANFSEAGGLLPRHGAEDCGPGALRASAAVCMLREVLLNVEVAVGQLAGAADPCLASDESGDEDDDSDDGSDDGSDGQC
mmetsp:Transcript_6512/g.20101  ORF Transcript_6512/g.20101 Transcript_6512/m.20101 type:complete len:394 (+) Transcript_6512:1-1182(+)